MIAGDGYPPRAGLAMLKAVCTAHCIAELLDPDGSYRGSSIDQRLQTVKLVAEAAQRR